MYERYYGLRERPFELTSNPRYLLLTPTHTEALSMLQYGIRGRKGIVVLTGEAGTGKTTVIRAAMASQPHGQFVVINNPFLTKSEFAQHLADGFSLGEEAAASKTRFLSELTRKLEEIAQSGGQTALIVDEAQTLSYDLLEEVRLLANIETDEEKLLPVVLAGQPELGERLNEPSLRQLKQRVALRCSLGRLQTRETVAYVAGRIRVAGGEAELFTTEAVELIHVASGGVPRIISAICDNALIIGFAADERRVSCNTVLQACRDLDVSIDGTRPEEPSERRGLAGSASAKRAPAQVEIS
jgi:general secretion pathway protein A